uniref:Uncharacterized protein n=1 Tax=Amblyomma aureolatum TaxID=187763 RepID=A0A1E1XDV4_9ACAR
MASRRYASQGRGGYQLRGAFNNRRPSGFRNAAGPAAKDGSFAPMSRPAAQASFRTAPSSFAPETDSYPSRDMLAARAAAAAHRATAAVAVADNGGGARDKPAMHSVSTWTVQVGEVPISYVSREKWRDQARPEKGMPPDAIQEPFRGCTLEDRHPNEPKATYTEEEMKGLCPICGTLVIRWKTHKDGKLHRDRVKAHGAVFEAAAAGPTQQDVIAALRVLQATRPDIIAASLAAAAPGLLSVNAATGNATPPAERTRRAGRSRSPSPERKRHNSRWNPQDGDNRYGDTARAAARAAIAKSEAVRAAASAATQQILGGQSRVPGHHYSSGSYTWR